MAQDFEKFKNIPPEFRERLRERQAQRKVESDKLLNKEDIFEDTGSVTAARNPNGTIIKQASIGLPIRISPGTHPSAEVFTIHEYRDSHGNIVYWIPNDETKGTKNELKALSDTINAQKAASERLNPQEKTRLQIVPQLFGKAEGEFGAYLRNEALGDLYRKLK